jgi:hypothetical protein
VNESISEESSVNNIHRSVDVVKICAYCEHQELELQALILAPVTAISTQTAKCHGYSQWFYLSPVALQSEGRRMNNFFFINNGYLQSASRKL